MNTDLVNREKALELIKQVAERYIEMNGRPPRILIAVGGTAMALHDLRDESEDVDLFSASRDLEAVCLEFESKTGYRIDVTSKTNIWGDLNIHDIEKSSVVIEQVLVLGHSVDIAAISPETLFVVKASSLRVKDREDLKLIIPVTSPDAILKRFSSLWDKQDSFVRDEALTNIVSEIQLASESMVSPDWFKNIPPSIMKKWTPLIEQDFPFAFDQDDDPGLSF